MSKRPKKLQKNTKKDNDQLLAELRAKTAQLTGKVAGDEPTQHRTLHLDNSVKATKNHTVKTHRAKQENEHPIRSLTDDADEHANDPAVSLIRQKLSKIYKKEPDAEIEAQEAIDAGPHRSVHQQFMYELTTSGKSLADIQTEWHEYYVALPEEQKHEVWREFYANQKHSSRYAQAQMKQKESSKQPQAVPLPQPQTHPKELPLKKPEPIAEPAPDDTDDTTDAQTPQSTKRTVGSLKSSLHSKVSADGRLRPVHHVKSLLFGLGLAGVVGLIITFTFFNEVFIAPFISPSQSVSATPIIGSSTEVGPEPKIIIPKINLEVPVVFDLGSIQEEDIQNALEDGVVHFASSPNPGEIGNSVIVGHSSNNILNAGKYKFAFVLLKRLEVEDTFFVQRDGVRYTYKIYEKRIVPPSEVSVLQTQDRANTMTLITCDPPGTSINRLIVVAEQISPDPAGNTASTAPDIPIEEVELPSNAPSLWSRIWPF